MPASVFSGSFFSNLFGGGQAQQFPTTRDALSQTKTGQSIGISPYVSTTPSSGYASPIGPQPLPQSYTQYSSPTQSKTYSTGGNTTQPKQTTTAPQTGISVLGSSYNGKTAPSGQVYVRKDGVVLLRDANNPTPENNPAPQEQGNPYDSYINDVYGPSLEFLGGQRDQLRSQLEGIPQYFEQQFAPYYQDLENARNQGLQQNEQQQYQTRVDKQSALDQANRLFAELRQRNQQLYGGSSGVGEFANEFQGRQQAQNIGNINQTTAQNINALQQQATEIQTQYQSEVARLNAEKQAAIVERQNALQEALNQIDSQQASISGSKAQDKYNALKEFQAQKQAIEQQTQQTLQQLGANALSAQQQIAANVAAYQAQAGQTPDLANFPGAEYAQVLPQVAAPGGGQITPGLVKKRIDENLGVG